MVEVTQEMPRALLEQSCCIGLIGKNGVIDCETRAEAEELLDWLCDGRAAQTTALAAKEAENAELRAKVERLPDYIELFRIIRAAGRSDREKARAVFAAISLTLAETQT